jgi:hypothetical protein
LLQVSRRGPGLRGGAGEAWPAARGGLAGGTAHTGVAGQPGRHDAAHLGGRGDLADARGVLASMTTWPALGRSWPARAPVSSWQGRRGREQVGEARFFSNFL